MVPRVGLAHSRVLHQAHCTPSPRESTCPKSHPRQRGPIRPGCPFHVASPQLRRVGARHCRCPASPTPPGLRRWSAWPITLRSWWNSPLPDRCAGGHRTTATRPIRSAWSGHSGPKPTCSSQVWRSAGPHPTPTQAFRASQQQPQWWRPAPATARSRPAPEQTSPTPGGAASWSTP